MPINDPDKRRQYSREWVSKRRADFFADKACSNCGSKMNLQLHHIDPSQKTSHKIWSWSEQRRNDEIAKCVVLCQHCHKVVHNQIPAPLIHGTCNAYHQKKCRCELCREWRRKNYVEYRVRRECAQAVS